MSKKKTATSAVDTKAKTAVDTAAEAEEVTEQSPVTSQQDYESYIQSLVDDDSPLYRGGNALSPEEFLRSAYADAHIDRLSTQLSQAAAEQNARMAAMADIDSAGYRDYARQAQAQAYRNQVTKASRTLAALQPDFYEDLPLSDRATTDQRFRIISYALTNNFSHDESMIYGLANGLAYDEAKEVADSAERLLEMIRGRFEDIGK